MDLASTEQHYESHLAPVYEWMLGGAEAAFRKGEAELDRLGIPDPVPGEIAIDLGAGPGTHAIPLARRGYSVVAIDSSQHLLERLAAHAQGLAIGAVRADITAFPRHVPERARLIACLGDTIVHLRSREEVVAFLALCARRLVPCGSLLLGFRDLTSAPPGSRAFIPVRGDASRILTCLLEHGEDAVEVTDILHERKEGEWSVRASRYRKLRLEPSWLAGELCRAGFEVSIQSTVSGMALIRADLAAREGLPPCRDWMLRR